MMSTAPRPPDLDTEHSAHAQLLRQVADSLVALDYEPWQFGDSIAFEGMLAASQAMNEPRVLGFVHGFLRGWAATRTRAFVPLDCTAPGLALVEAHRRTGDPVLLGAALDLGRYLISRPRLGDVFITFEHTPLRQPHGPGELAAEELSLLKERPAGVFIDCLHFDPPFFAALGSITHNEDWIDESIRQAIGYISLLQVDSGLFDHFMLTKSSATYGPGWGRGQGWALLGLLDLLEELPPTTDRVAEIRTATSRLASEMLRLQRPDGHWHAIVGDATSGDETSTAAFMAAGLVRAVRLGLAGDDAMCAAERALDAAVAASDSRGILSGASEAVGACTSSSHYAHLPRGVVSSWGQGPLALALAEFTKNEGIEVAASQG